MPGATDVKVEQATALPVLEISVDKAEIARRGLSLAAVQDVIGTAVGGRDGRHGVRGRPALSRSWCGCPIAVRNDIDALRTCPSPLPRRGAEPPAQSLPLSQRRPRSHFSEGPNQISRENGKRRVVVTAKVRGRDIGSVVDGGAGEDRSDVQLPPGYWLTWGGQFENFAAARQRLSIVVPVCFVLIFLLLLAALGLGAGCTAGVQRGAAGA